MRRKLEISLIILIILALSFLRESFFKTTNVLINHAGIDVKPEISSIFNFLHSFSSDSLLKIKWIATLGFIFLFAFLTWLIAKKLFPDTRILFPVLFAFGSVILLSAISMLFGWMIPEIKNPAYYFARWVTGSAQSPLLPAIVCLLIFYQKRNANK